MCEEKDSLIEMIYSHKFNYYILGTIQGFISVWKLRSKKTLIHEFEKHVRSICNLTNYASNPDLFFAASLDGNITVYCLDKFTKQYVFNI